MSIHFGRLEELQPIQPVLDQGVLAMTLFFMLSGFILSYRYSSFSTPEDTHQYTASRIARLYPVYFFMGVTTLWLIGEGASQFLIIDRFGLFGAIPFALAAIFFFIFAIQAWFPSLFNVWNFGGSWSLSVEAFFYTLFPTFRKTLSRLGSRTLVFATFGLPIVMAIITMGLIVSQQKEHDTSKIYYVLPIFRLPEFLFGICGYILFVERGIYRKALASCGIVASILLLAGIYWRDLPGLIDWGAFAAVVFMSVFVFCLQLNAPALLKRTINYLGRISYCVYMAQFTTIPVLRKFKDSLSLEEEWLISIASTFVFAILTYHFVEVLAYSKTRDLSLRLSQRLRSHFEK